MIKAMALNDRSIEAYKDFSVPAYSNAPNLILLKYDFGNLKINMLATEHYKEYIKTVHRQYLHYVDNWTRRRSHGLMNIFRDGDSFGHSICLEASCKGFQQGFREMNVQLDYAGEITPLNYARLLKRYTCHRLTSEDSDILFEQDPSDEDVQSIEYYNSLMYQVGVMEGAYAATYIGLCDIRSYPDVTFTKEEEVEIIDFVEDNWDTLPFTLDEELLDLILINN